MRIAAFPVEESELRFDFSAALWCDKHDATNTVFDSVDFIIKETDRQIWLEVKKWVDIPPRRGGQRRSFLAKMKSKVYFRETLRAKFLGTCAYLALTDAFIRENILHVALLESPRMDSALMLRATERLQSLVRTRFDSVNNGISLQVRAAVINVAEWNALFAEYPVSPV